MIFHELLVLACIATAPGHCEDVIINAKPPWIDRQSCEAVGKRMAEKLGGSYECTPYRSPTDVWASRSGNSERSLQKRMRWPGS